MNRLTRELKSRLPWIGWLVDFFFPPIKSVLDVPPDADPGWLILERTFTMILRFSALLAPVVTALSGPEFANCPASYNAFLIIEFCLWLLAVARAISLNLRVIGFLLAFYAFGVVETTAFGYSAESFIFFMIVVVGAGVLMGRKGRWIALFVSLATLSVFGWQITRGNFTPLAIDQGLALSSQSLKPVPILASFAAGATGLSIVIVTIWENLRHAWKRERHAINLLEQERDLLEQRVAERTRALAVAKEGAEAANRAKSVFLANMSHDLRTPLNAILGFAQLMSREPETTPAQHDNLAVITRSGKHLLELINDVLDLAKIEAGRLELEPSGFHLSTFLSGIGNIIDQQTRRKKIRFRFEGKDLPAVVRGDERRLRQVLSNLLSNAVKFTVSGEVVLRVERVERRDTRVDSQEAEPVGEKVFLLRFSVEDSGLGIPPERLEKIFEPFERGREQLNQSEGTGLGLAISRELVQAMGGQLQVSSRLGRGSVFSFELTLPEERGWSDSGSLAARRIVGLAGKGAKVLVVDDLPDNRAVVVNFLSPLGFEIMEAGNGEEALAIATNFRPQAILTDLMMPQLNGYELTRRLRADPKLQDTVVIGVSARAFAENRQEFLTAGGNDFIPKPVQVEQLFETLGHHLGLEFHYDQGGQSQRGGETEAAIPPSSVIYPAAAEIAKLHELTLIGDIAGLQEKAARLGELDERYAPFTAEVQRLASGFQISKICALLEPLLE